MESFDKFIRDCIDDGMRDEAAISEKFLDAIQIMSPAELRDVLLPVLRAYASNRTRNYVRVVEREAMIRPGQPKDVASAKGRAARPGSTPAIERELSRARKHFSSSGMSALEARQAMLSETVFVPGTGEVAWAEMTVAFIDRRIEHLQTTMSGMKRSIRDLQLRKAAMVKAKVAKFGELPIDVTFDSRRTTTAA